MSGMVDDLKFAMQARVAVDLTLLNGEHLLTGVHSVDEDDGSVNLWAPQTMGNDTTRRRIRIGDIMSLSVTDVDYPRPDGS
jgi:hypothetical protein